MTQRKLKTGGFTLLELVITLTIVSLVGTMMILFITRSLSDSVAPIQRLKTAVDLHMVMDNITEDFDRPKWKQSTAYAVGDVIKPESAFGRVYTCTQAGTSDTAEPDWPDEDGGTVADNNATWTESSAAFLESLRTSIGSEGTSQNNGFGQYTVLENRFIKFDATNNEQALSLGDPKAILKVTIQNSNNEVLTSLYILG